MWHLIALIPALLAFSSPTPSLYETRRETLDEMEKNGLSFATMLCGHASTSSADLSASCPAYHQLTRVLAADIAGRLPKIESAEAFNPVWLASKSTNLRLIAVVPRWDRAPLVDGSCGEIRLVYRLSGVYDDNQRAFHTFLPLTLMLALELPADATACRKLAGEYQSGTLSLMELLQRTQNRSRIRLEVNLQNLRIPPPTLPDSAGYTEYLLRVFRLSAGKLVVSPLENTPDVERLQRDPALLRQLVQWIAQPENLVALGAGQARIPDRFLATVAVSIAPFGSLRLANAPFSRLLDKTRLKALRLDADHLLLRLNRSSCQGCHQTGSDAGFHLLGESLADSFEYNRTSLPASTHFFSEQAWRQSALKAFVANGRWPNRPLPGRTAGKEGSAGDHCTRTDSPIGFHCREGLSCRQLWDVPDRPELEMGYCQQQKAPLPGEPCLLGRWKEDRDQRAGLSGLSTTRCFGYGDCLPQEIGFPGGICSLSCQPPQAGTACQPVPALQKFADCVAEGGGLSKCFATAATPVALRSCDVDTPCRPDYVCAASNNRGRVHSEGVCVPPYFLPQLNLQNHRF